MRGDVDFHDIAAYRALHRRDRRPASPHAKRIDVERGALRKLPGWRTCDYEEVIVRVTSSTGPRIGFNYLRTPTLGRSPRPCERVEIPKASGGNGIFLHSVGDDLVGCHRRVSALCRVATPATTTLSTDRTLIVPNEMVKAVNRLIGRATGSVTLRRSERLFAIEGAGSSLVTKRIEADFPT